MAEEARNVREAYYAKEHIRTLQGKLENFRVYFRACKSPKRKAWLEQRIVELRSAMYQRTGMWY